MVHDLLRVDYVDPFVEEKLFKSFSENFYNLSPAMFEISFNNIMQDPNNSQVRKQCTAIIHNTIRSILKEKQFLFPSFFSEIITKSFCFIPRDMFVPSPEFIEEVAQAVGLTLKKKTFLQCKGEWQEKVSVTDATAEDGSSVGYVLEKEGNGQDFRNTPAFKNLIEKTKKAEEQCQNIEFRKIKFYPFIEAVK